MTYSPRDHRVTCLSMITKSDITEHAHTTTTTTATRGKIESKTFTFITIFGIHVIYSSHCSVTSFCHSTSITTKSSVPFSICISPATSRNGGIREKQETS